MTDINFHGVIPPVVIPLTEERTLDLEALERSINRMIDAGVDGLFFLGSSGEVAFLTDAQRYHVRGRRRAQPAGADGGHSHSAGG